MPLSFRENVSLAPLTTFGVGGSARYLAEISRESELPEALSFADRNSLPIFVLGGGSNLLVPDEGYPGLVLRLQIGGIEREGDKFTAGAGVEWDKFVDRAVAEDCAGVECLAGIPGSVGGTPVQNVGAYGQEVAETIVGVRVYDRAGRRFWNMTAEECHFRYRASIFNTDERNRYIVTQVTYSLRP
ncbi:MAG: FAD-binding protein, partial [Bryocella sp.]